MRGHTPCRLLPAKEAGNELVRNRLWWHVVEVNFRHGHLRPRAREQNRRRSPRKLLVIFTIVVVGLKLSSKICNLVIEDQELASSDSFFGQ